MSLLEKLREYEREVSRHCFDRLPVTHRLSPHCPPKLISQRHHARQFARLKKQKIVVEEENHQTGQEIDRLQELTIQQVLANEVGHRCSTS